MAKDKEKDIKAYITVLLIIIISIIFAAISSNFIIELKLMDKNNSNDKLNVIFSSTNGFSQDMRVFGYPSEFSSGPAIIKNLDDPMIVGLNAHFTEPGQSVTYSFNILNAGAYDAFLNEIIYGTLDSNGLFKSCSSKNSTYDYPEVCDYIKVTLDIGSNFNNLKADESMYVSNHVIKKGTYEPISVTISYLSDAKKIDTPVYITFANIYLKYGQVQNTN